MSGATRVAKCIASHHAGTAGRGTRAAYRAGWRVANRAPGAGRADAPQKRGECVRTRETASARARRGEIGVLRASEYARARAPRARAARGRGGRANNRVGQSVACALERYIFYMYIYTQIGMAEVLFVRREAR